MTTDEWSAMTGLDPVTDHAFSADETGPRKCSVVVHVCHVPDHPYQCAGTACTLPSRCDYPPEGHR
jgi:hypothetical protein